MLPLTGAFFIQEKQLKFAFLPATKAPWLIGLTAVVILAFVVAMLLTPKAAAADTYWPVINLVVKALAFCALLLVAGHVTNTVFSVSTGTKEDGNSCNSLAANGCLANSLQAHRQNLELQAMQHVAVAAVMHGRKDAGELARAAIDQLLGVGSLEYAKASLDEPAKRVAAHWQELAAQQACTCTGNQACSNCPPQRFGSVNEPGKHKRLWRLEPHQERVVDEKDELDDRLRKLKKFIDTNQQFNELPDKDKELMRKQSVAMEAYASVLDERIKIFREINPAQK